MPVFLQDTLHQFLADVPALIGRVHQQVVQEGHGLPIVQAPHQADELIPSQAEMTWLEFFIPRFSWSGYRPESQPTERNSLSNSATVKSFVS